MSTQAMRCPKSGQDCENILLCGKVNEPLNGSIVKVRQGVGGVSWKLAQVALLRELSVQFNPIGVEVNPEPDHVEGVLICPIEILSGDFGEKYGPKLATDAAHNIAANCVENVITDLLRK